MIIEMALGTYLNKDKDKLDEHTEVLNRWLRGAWVCQCAMCLTGVLIFHILIPASISTLAEHIVNAVWPWPWKVGQEDYPSTMLRNTHGSSEVRGHLLYHYRIGNFVGD